MTRRRSSLPWLPLLLAPFALGAEAITLAPADIAEWQTHSFSGETRYELVDTAEGAAVHARCTDGNGSGLVLARDIDLRETPILEWRWRVGNVHEGLDAHSKEGDDYAARLYVVDEHRVLRWRTRALNYVWANEQPVGSDWPNPFTDRAHMIAVASGAPDDDGWHSQRRNVREDFQRHFDRDVEQINAVALMTDCDNGGDVAEAWYGTIRLLPESRD